MAPPTTKRSSAAALPISEMCDGADVLSTMTLMLAPAALTNEQIAFYSTSATVIPVLALGSILAVATFARTASRGLDRFADAVIAESRRQRADMLRAVRARGVAKRILKPLLQVQELFLRFSFVGLGRRFIAPLLLLGFLIPAAGEVSALSALASGHADPRTNHAVWLGLGVSTVVAIVPILEVTVLLVAPVDSLQRLIEKSSLRREPTVTVKPQPEDDE